MHILKQTKTLYNHPIIRNKENEEKKPRYTTPNCNTSVKPNQKIYTNINFLNYVVTSKGPLLLNVLIELRQSSKYISPPASLLCRLSADPYQINFDHHAKSINLA